MSTATKNGVYALLRADTALVALLAADPNDAREPAIFDARMSPETPVYNCITYRLVAARTTKGFERAVPTVVGPGSPSTVTSAVREERLDMAVWTQSNDTGVLGSIVDRLNANLNFTAFAISGGRVFYSAQIAFEDDLFDAKLEASFCLVSYRLRVETT